MQTIVMYLGIATGIFVAISAFLTLGASFFQIEDSSVDVWWHILFYMSFTFYFVALRMLVGLGSFRSGSRPGKRYEPRRDFGAFIALCGVVLVFLTSVVDREHRKRLYELSLDSWGLHHFIAFIFAGGVAW